MKVRSLYHTPRGERGIGKAIVGVTWLYALFYDWKALKHNFSHEELWFPDGKGEFKQVLYKTPPSECIVSTEVDGLTAGTYTVHMGTAETKIFGTCLSSTTRGDSNGVRFAQASKVLKHPERWSYIEFDASDEVVADLTEIVEENMVGSKYDWLGVTLGFATPWGINSKRRWYCSELCDWFKGYLGFKRHKTISPRRSAHEMVELGYELRSLV